MILRVQLLLVSFYKFSLIFFKKTQNSSFPADITVNSPYIAQELSLLKKAFNEERNQRLKLQAKEFKSVLENLEPIYVPQPKDERINELEKDLAKVKYDWVMSLVKGAEFPTGNGGTISNVHKLLQDHKSKQKLARQEIKSKAENLASEILDEYLQRKPFRAVKGDFSKFPSNELSRVSFFLCLLLFSCWL